MDRIVPPPLAYDNHSASLSPPRSPSFLGWSRIVSDESLAPDELAFIGLALSAFIAEPSFASPRSCFPSLPSSRAASDLLECALRTPAIIAIVAEAPPPFARSMILTLKTSKFVSTPRASCTESRLAVLIGMSLLASELVCEWSECPALDPLRALAAAKGSPPDLFPIVVEGARVNDFEDVLSSRTRENAPKNPTPSRSELPLIWCPCPCDDRELANAWWLW